MGQDLAAVAAPTIEQMLAKNKTKIERLSGQAIDIHRFVTVVHMCISRTPDLRKCTELSLYRACMQAAEIGLYPGGIDGDAYLVPFYNSDKRSFECTLIPGYKGLIRLALDEPRVGKVVARAVFDGDEFDYSFGTEEYIRHKPRVEPDPDKLTHCYTICTLTNGQQIFDVMLRKEIDTIQARAKSKGGPWKTDFIAMATKCPVRRNAKFWPRTRGLQKAIGQDNAVESGDWSVVQYEIEEAQPEQIQQAAKQERVEEKRKAMRREEAVVTSPSETPAPAIEPCPACGSNGPVGSCSCTLDDIDAARQQPTLLDAPAPGPGNGQLE